VNFLSRAGLPFPLSRSGDVPVWPLNRAVDEYAASPIEVIRSFLKQQEFVYSNRSPWNNLFVVAAYDASSHKLFVHESENSFAYLMVNVPMNLLEWCRLELLEWHPSNMSVENFPTVFDWGTTQLNPYLSSVVLLEDSDPNQQLTFPLGGTFSPSKALIELWAESVNSYPSDSDREKFALALAPSDLELQQEFAKTLHSVLGAIAQQRRYDESDDLHITQSGRFTQRLQLEISEQFLVGGYELSMFLTMLGNELSDAVTRGVEIEGGWGHVERDSKGDLVYVLTPPNIFHDKMFVRAKRVE
jgi:hypothetical protein